MKGRVINNFSQRMGVNQLAFMVSKKTVPRSRPRLLVTHARKPQPHFAPIDRARRTLQLETQIYLPQGATLGNDIIGFRVSELVTNLYVLFLVEMVGLGAVGCLTPYQELCVATVPN